MARLNLNDATEMWQSNNDPNRRYYVTRNHRVVMVIGKAFASAKMGYICAKSEDDATLTLNFRGRGDRFAHADNDPQVREFLNRVATRQV